MRKLLSLAVLASVCAFAESPVDVFDKAPPKIDKALRERVTKFFQAHVDGKFRVAEEVVHGDSKENYYNSEKQRFISFEIGSIKYFDRFKRAEVVTLVEVDWRNSRLGVIRVKPPMKTTWKMDGGKWYWYVMPRKEWDTPFGVMRPGADPKQPGPINIAIPDPETLLNQVRVNRTEVRLSSDKASSDSIEVSNNMPGELALRAEEHGIPGLEVKFDRDKLKSGETANVTFSYTPPDNTAKSGRAVRIYASPTNQVYTISVLFAVPAPVRNPLELPVPQK